jgi:hypothetical protein
MKSIFTRHRFFVSIVLIINVLCLNVNSQTGSKEELDKRAMKNFQEEKYENAMQDFKTLHDLYPKDPRISYFYGRSCLHSNQNLEEATNLLKFAATRNYGEDAYFYLGKALQLSYQFDEAEVAYNTFKSTAKERYLKSYNIEYWITSNQNAKKSLTAALKTPVIKNVQIQNNVIESAFSGNKEGKYIYVPDEFKSETDKSSNYQTLMFLSKNIYVGDYLYFDSKSVKSKQGTDIYRVKRINNEEYSLPEALPLVVNTIYDEAYPFFSKETETLYFSSKGFNTSGGYDIFYTHLDTVNQTWTTPEKLEFPINTPFDDYLYTIADNGKNATFISNRNYTSNAIKAYTIVIQPHGEYVSLWNLEEITAAAELKPEDNTLVKLPVEETVMVAENKVTQSIPDKTMPSEQMDQGEYEKTIKQAMVLQASSDSLVWIVKELKKQAQNENNYKKRQELGANISLLDKESKRIQNQANEKFNLADQIRNGQNNAHTIQPSDQNENIKTFTYTSENTVKPEPSNVKDAKSDSYTTGYQAATTAAVTEMNNAFRIMGSSPYSKDNPIPLESKLPEGLVYRIQLGAFSDKLEDNAFKGLTPVTAEKNTNSPVTKYYVGYFPSIEKARKALEDVKKYGYPDAFLVSYFKGEKISVQKAREIEFTEK